MNKAAALLRTITAYFSAKVIAEFVIVEDETLSTDGYTTRIHAGVTYGTVYDDGSIRLKHVSTDLYRLRPGYGFVLDIVFQGITEVFYATNGTLETSAWQQILVSDLFGRDHQVVHTTPVMHKRANAYTANTAARGSYGHVPSGATAQLRESALAELAKLGS